MRFPWRDTSSDIAGGQPPQWETPGGAQAKADKAEEESKKYTDEKNADFTAHVQNTTIHVTQTDKDNWNSKAPGNHTHQNATPTTPGFESAADKTKLDGIEDGANNYVHPATHPPSIIAQDTANRFVTDAEKAAWNAKAETTVATSDTKGLMSAADKTKLDGIESGAEVNQNAFSTFKAPGQADVTAGSKQETINFAGGTGITVTTDPAAKKVMITATGEATPGPHASSHITGGTDIIPDAVAGGASGLMSGDDATFTRNTGETKTGAQAKADAAETASKNYTDTRITELEKDVSDVAAVAAGAETPAGAQAKVNELGATIATQLADKVSQEVAMFYRGTLASGTGLNTINNNAIYRLSGSYPNYPSFAKSSDAVMVVFKGADYVVQTLYVSSADSGVAGVQKITRDGNGSIWSAWVEDGKASVFTEGTWLNGWTGDLRPKIVKNNKVVTIHFYGVRSGTATQPAFILPVGYRPVYDAEFLSDTTNKVSIKADGGVIPSGNLGYFTLTFVAHQ
ncbi:hypothetical protein JDW19_02410 [Paenibacillus polymyxa]|uniref:Uncharacterized protein n=1 Tax=Paenibacillus polymyxa TaxID=1406 RepID=A0A8I1IM15_PAEPO|nr:MULTISPECIES: hypothetical protein [Paenibacillus]KAF6576573.1 hypothetical protein G9G53_01285 [Paenibacillus sp. EKM206P]KAF6591293.1 hypothetical protein G9G52_02680 [Paenibacillus sp. EKM205P]MBM0631981.1 hypothetical protein [Paenibacillus polymyxa]